MFTGFSVSYAQIDTSGLWVNLDSIQISSTRINKTWLKSTQAITDLSYNSIQQHLDQKSLKENLMQAAGVFSLSANNFAQDLRISIRGFGTRSTFGVRGIKILVDGIPETTPDGQGQVDAIPLGLIQNIEVIKGPASLLYGNASGGVIHISTMSEVNNNLISKPLRRVKVGYGSFNSQLLDLTYAQKLGSSSFLVHANQTSTDGYREQSDFLSRQVKGRFDHRFSRFAKVNVQLDYLSSPRAKDSGALTQSQIDSSRVQARPSNKVFDTGESVDQFKVSSHFSLLASEQNTFDVYGFFTKRKFDGMLPYQVGGIVDLNRYHFGQGASYTLTKKGGMASTIIKYGYDLATQLDYRKRFSNNLGEKGILDNEQVEEFSNLGLFMIADINFGHLGLNGGLRWDHHALSVTDDFLFDGNDSGAMNMTSYNPSFGLNYRMGTAFHSFVNFSTSFETPSLNELTSNPTAPSGFNPDIEPMKATNFEVGLRVDSPDLFKMQFVLFHIRSHNEILPYEIDTIPDRVFFRNVGSTKRSGIEWEAGLDFDKTFSAQVSYSLSSFRFDEFVTPDGDFKGNSLPGLPVHNSSLSLTYRHESGLELRSQSQYVGSIYLNDENTVNDQGYFLTNLSFSYKLQLESYKILPFLHLNNLTNTSYNDNLRINATGSRYFEPGPGFNIFGGFQLSF